MLTKIKLVDNLDEINLFGKKHYKLNVSSSGDYQKEIVINPHPIENNNSIELLKLKIWCEKRNIKVTGYTSVNQMPLLSMLSDEVILLGGETMRDMYNGFVTTLSFDRKYVQKLPNFHEVITMHGAYPFPQYLQPIVQEAVDEISDKEFLDRYSKEVEICIHKSTWELFNSLDLPENIIVCEIKPLSESLDDRPAAKILKENSNLFKHPIKGIGYAFQKKLLERIGYEWHYMGIQILASLFLNWHFICVGGSANLFSLLPVKIAHISDIGVFMWVPLLRRLAVKRFGKIGHLMPSIGGQPMITDIKKFATDVNEFVEMKDLMQVKIEGTEVPSKNLPSTK